MNHQSCDSYVLEDILQDDCDLAQQGEFEQHLESCETCRDRLAQIAASEEMWTQAASHLSTIDQIELPKRLVSKLSNSTSFVLPTLSGVAPADEPQPAFDAQTDWTRILDPPAHPEMLGRIDQFEVDSKIGQGGMGIVLKGFDRELNRAVAIKVLAPHLAANGTARKRFAREAESAAAVMHPNVVPIYSVNSSPTRPYIVMQLVPGHSLQSLVQENGPLDPKDVVRVSMQVAAGLAAAHKQGLIHRDVKPGNVLIERDVTRVMITDFGLARAADDAGMTQTGWLAGTPHYMSPEQSKGDELDARSDLFSLGSLMFFLATGREPFRGDQPYAVIQKIISQRPTRPQEINSDIPATLADVIEKLLEKDPKNRFQSAAEVSGVLEKYLAYLQHPQKALPPKRILTSRRKRRRRWAGRVLMSIIALSAAGYFLVPAIISPTPIESNSGTARVGAMATPSTNLQPPIAATIPTAIGMGFDDSAYSQELKSAAQALERLEISFGQTPFLESSSASELNYSSRLQNGVDQIQTQFRQFESSFEPQKPVRQILEQLKQTHPKPSADTDPQLQLKTTPDTKGKFDED